MVETKDRTIARVIGKYKERYGKDFFFEENALGDDHIQYVVLTESIGKELFDALEDSDQKIEVKSIEGGLGEEFYISRNQIVNLYTRREESNEYLADQLIAGEVSRVYKPEEGNWAAVGVLHDFMDQAPIELGWIKFAAVSLDHGGETAKSQIKSFSKQELAKLLELYLTENSGIKYTLGGKTFDLGFDCSGFVQTVVHELTGLWLPRLSRWQALVGKEVEKGLADAGDIAYFKNPLSGKVDHVGIVARKEGTQLFVAHSALLRNGIYIQNVDEINPKSMNTALAGFRRIEHGN